jgi:hypothetical protein
MKRQAALALFAVSLTLLPACVTKVVVEPPTTTESVSTTSVLERTYSAKGNRQFMSSLQEDIALSDYEQLSAPGLASDACQKFSEGMSAIGWMRYKDAQGFGSPLRNNKLLPAIIKNAILYVCPEFAPIFFG